MGASRREDAAGRIARHTKRSRSARRQASIEYLEDRCLLSIYDPRTPPSLAPAPVDGTPLAADMALAFFVDGSPLANLSATVAFDGAGPVPANIVPSTGNGTQFVPGVGAIPQYVVTWPGGTFAPMQFGPGALKYVVQINDATDGTSASVLGSSDVQNSSPTTIVTNGGFAATAGTPVVNQQIAVFSDPSPTATPGSFIGSIDWGDGTPVSPANFVDLGSGQFGVEGSHTYAKPITTKITFQIFDSFGATVLGQTGTVTVANTAIDTPAPRSVSGMQGQLLNDVPLITFVSHNPLALPEFFTAAIDWGDGGTSLGTIRRVGSGLFTSTFQVSGSHTYNSTSGSPFTIGLAITDVFGGALLPQAVTATIIQSPLTVSVISYSANVATLTGASDPLAIVTDASGPHPKGNYVATIAWGDGSPNSTVNGSDFTAGPGGTLTVPSPGHTFTRAGLFPITVTVNNQNEAIGSGGGFASVNGSVASLTPSPVPAIAAQGGMPIPANSTVGRFVIGAAGLTPSGLTAVIDWGDGSPTALGTIVATGSAASSTTFDVKGNHIYARAGAYTITTTFTDVAHNTATTTTAVNVADQQLISVAAIPVKGYVGRQSPNVPVATFIDPNPLTRATAISAVIDWGDGTGSRGAVAAIGSLENGTLFAITGTHTYSAASSSPFRITVNVAKAANNANKLTIVSNATIAQSALTVSVLPVIAAARNPAYIPANSIIAVFTDTRGAQSPSTYTANISWGDGRASRLVRVTSLGGGVYAVLAGHTYAARGVFAIRVNIQATDSLTKSSRTGYGANLATVTAGPAAVQAAIRAQSRTARHRQQ